MVKVPDKNQQYKFKTDNYIIVDGLLLRDNIYDVRRK